MLNGHVGVRLKSARLRKNLTIAEVHKETGISIGNLSDLERGRSLPSSTALFRLSELYEVPVDWILKGGHEPWNTPPAQRNRLRHDPDLANIIGYLEHLWRSPDPELRVWAKIQFRRAFDDFDDFVESRKQRETS